MYHTDSWQATATTFWMVYIYTLFFFYYYHLLAVFALVVSGSIQPRSMTGGMRFDLSGVCIILNRSFGRIISPLLITILMDVQLKVEDSFCHYILLLPTYV